MSIPTRPPLGPLLVAGFALSSALSLAQPSAAADRAPAYQALLACRALTDAAARLACFDEKVDRLAEAERKAEVVVVEPSAVTAGGSVRYAPIVPKIETLDTTVTKAVRSPDRKWVLTFADGGRWRQVDERELARWPTAGSKVHVRTAAAGSYLVNLDGQTAIRMEPIRPAAQR